MCRALCTLFVLLTFAACATPEYRVPPLDEALAATEEERIISAAMETALERRRRVYDLAWPVLVANAAFCDETAPLSGVTLADRKRLAKMSGGLSENALETIGIPEGLRVVHAWRGSPAAEAGVPGGALVEAVNGEPATDDPERAAKAIGDALEEEGEATLTAEGVTYTLTGTVACDVPVKIGTSQALNAHAMSGVTIYTGLIRSLDDEGLKAVIAHELAHVALGHKGKYLRNTAVTGGVVTGPALYALGRFGDRMAALFGAGGETHLSAGALRLAAPWTEGFEAEADYVGLYMHARAGGDPEAAAALFEVFGRESPGTITVRATHPLIPERLARLRATAAEIADKKERGLPLLPDPKE